MAAAQSAAEAAVLLEAYSMASEQLRDRAADVARGAWLSFQGWYDTAAVAALARDMTGTSAVAEQAAVGLSQQYMSSVVASLREARAELPKVDLPPLRNGADLTLVQMRPADTYRKAIATGLDHETALEKALGRAEGIMRTNLSLSDRSAQQELMRSLGVTQYRRVLRPELAKTGSCGLCIVAADRLYKSDHLLPIHPPSCHCVSMPVLDGKDPGRQMNRDDLDKLYAEAGSNKAADLRRTRYVVHEHGEFGPVLTKDGDHFRGPSKVALEDDPERAARMLAKTLPVLDRLEQAGGPEGPLQYQRELVARLRRIVGS